MVSAKLTSMLRTSSSVRSSESSTVVEDNEVGDGGVAEGRLIMKPLALVVVDLLAFLQMLRYNSRSTHLDALDELTNWIIREFDSGSDCG